VLSKSPLNGTPIEVRFRDGVPERNEAVLFMPDFFLSTSPPEPGVSVFDDWCPQANLFEDHAASHAWAECERARGQTVSLAEAAARGRQDWHPMVPAPQRARRGVCVIMPCR
jgi:hypothetical protein